MKFVEKIHPQLFFAFRVIVGFLFLSHGLQKLFGWFGGSAQPLLSLMGVAGILELGAGLFVMLGLFTRLSAFIGALVMIVAYFKVHAGQGLFPILNGGELALLYLAVFLVFIGHGAGKWSLEKAIFKKEFF